MARLGVLGLAASAWMGLAVGAPGAGAAGPDWTHPVEVEGRAPVAEPGRGALASELRERALRDAVARAVDRVALDLLEASPRDPPAFDAEGLEAILGPDPFDYALRFGIREDRGLRAPRGPEAAGAEAEYVVRASVQVDVARVRRRLEAAGLLEPPRPGAPGRVIEVVLAPVGSYAALAWVREAIEAGGAGTAIPGELAPGRAVLRVTTSLRPEELLGVLRRQAPPELHIGLRGLDARSLTLALEAPGLSPPGIRARSEDGGPDPGAPRRAD